MLGWFPCFFMDSVVSVDRETPNDLHTSTQELTFFPIGNLTSNVISLVGPLRVALYALWEFVFCFFLSCTPVT